MSVYVFKFFVMAVKCHTERCVLDPSKVTVHRGTKKRCAICAIVVLTVVV